MTIPFRNVCGLTLRLFVLASGAIANENRYAALAEAESALSTAWKITELHYRTALFVNQPAKQYGLYDPRGSNVFAQGDTLYIYAEPKAFQYASAGSNLNTIDLVFDLLLFDPNRKPLFTQNDFGMVKITSRAENREVMFMADIALNGVPDGDYELDLRMRDLNKDQAAVVTLPFSVRTAN